MGFHALVLLLLHPLDKAFNQAKCFIFVIVHGRQLHFLEFLIRDCQDHRNSPGMFLTLTRMNALKGFFKSEAPALKGGACRVSGAN